MVARKKATEATPKTEDKDRSELAKKRQNLDK